MKIGDAVRFIGFEGHPPEDKDFATIGIIVEVHEIYGKKRYDVSWPNGSVGIWLYPETLRVINGL